MAIKSIRRCLAALGLIAFCLLASTSFADHGGSTHIDPGLVVPATSTSGDYLVTWNSSAVVLQEKINGGSYSNVVTTGSSHAFSNKPSGIYTYRMYFGYCYYTCVNYYSEPESIIVTVGPGNGITTPPIEEIESISAGVQPYYSAVAANGDASVVVPIDLIPGVAGFAPSLAIEYASGRGVDRLLRSLPEDTLGYGWRLAGLSDIRRCVVDKPSGSSIGLNNNDNLCLDGMPLRLISGSHLSVGAIYRTVIESYQRIEIKGTTGSIWFEVRQPDGTVLEYGSGVGGRVSKSGGTDYQWSLSRATSEDGNVIDYVYFHDSANGVNYPRKISYDGAEVTFEYRSRSDAAPINIGSATQTQTAFLHSINVLMDETMVRQYVLLDEVVSSRRRLNIIQLCGYDEDGTGRTCLKPLDMDWYTPNSTMQGVPILLSGITDSLDAVTTFEYTTLISSSNDGLFSERPFGNATAPQNTQLLSGSGALRHSVTKTRNDNGANGFFDTTYSYQDRGLESTRNWGFLGFFAQKVRNEQTGVVSYNQYRMDYPYFGSLSQTNTYEGQYQTGDVPLSSEDFDYSVHTQSYSVGPTYAPYIARHVSFIYEGAEELGATEVIVTPTFDGAGFPLEESLSSTTGTGVSASAPPPGWGRVPGYSFANVIVSSEYDKKFTNNVSGTNWIVGFINDIEIERWQGAPIGAGVAQKVSYVPVNGKSKIASINRFPNHPSLSLTLTLGYDSSGRLISETIVGSNVAARTTQYGQISGFDSSRYPLNITNPKGHTTTLSTCDRRFGVCTSFSGPNGETGSTTLDQFGRITSRLTGAASAETTSIAWDSSAIVDGVVSKFKVEVDAPSTPLRRIYVDRIGRVIRTEKEGFDGTIIRTDSWFDPSNRLERKSLPYFAGENPRYVVWAYDSRNRVESISRPHGGSTEFSYTAINHTLQQTVSEVVKDSIGNAVGSYDKVNVFNVAGQLLRTTDAHGTASAVETSYAYDHGGRPDWVQVDGGSSGTALITAAYDEAGNVISMLDPDAGAVTKTYTALSELRTILDNKGQLTTLTYDTLGRLKTRVDADGTSTWTWDSAAYGKGMLASRTNGSGFVETYGYVEGGNKSSISTSITPISGGAAANYTRTFEFDSEDRISKVSGPDTNKNSVVFNSRGYVSQYKGGDTLGMRLHHTIDGQDPFGQVTIDTYRNGVETIRASDPDSGRPLSSITKNGSLIVHDLSYEWQTNGILESRSAAPDFLEPGDRKEEFQYDNTSRLLLSETFVNTLNVRDLIFDFSLLGNVLSKTSTVPGDLDALAFGYGAGAAGPHAVTSAILDSTSTSLDYDANGAIEKYDSLDTTSEDTFIQYNAKNQPVTIVVGSSLLDPSPKSRDQFRYGPDGELYTRTTEWTEEGTTKTEVVNYVGDTEFIELTGEPTVTSVTKRWISPNVRRVESVGPNPFFTHPWDSYSHNLEMLTATSYEYVHRDHLGSPESITDWDGNKTESIAFDPFGSRKNGDWSRNVNSSELDDILRTEQTWIDNPGYYPILSSHRVRNSHGFTGHEHLYRSGLIHMKGRVYDPRTARFLSPDPLVQTPTFSQSWNRYSYAQNSPLSFVDPSGFECYSGTSSVEGGGTSITTTICTGMVGAELAWLQSQYSSRVDIVAGGGSGQSVADFLLDNSRGRTRDPRACPAGQTYAGGPSNSTVYGAFDIASAGIYAASWTNRVAGVSDGISPYGWRGINNKWYRLGWQGNGSTGGRSVAFEQTRSIRIVGKGLLYTSVFLSGSESIYAFSHGDNWRGADALVDSSAAFVGLLGPYGFTFSVAYGITDASPLGDYLSGVVATGLCACDSQCL